MQERMEALSNCQINKTRVQYNSWITEGTSIHLASIGDQHVHVFTSETEWTSSTSTSHWGASRITHCWPIWPKSVFVYPQHWFMPSVIANSHSHEKNKFFIDSPPLANFMWYVGMAKHRFKVRSLLPTWPKCPWALNRNLREVKVYGQHLQQGSDIADQCYTVEHPSNTLKHQPAVDKVSIGTTLKLLSSL